VHSSTVALRGKVTDRIGAAIPRAAVEVYADEQMWRAVTDESGVFVVQPLPPGTYELEATAPGFRTKLIQNLVIPNSAPEPLFFALEVGTSVDHCGDPLVSYSPSVGQARLKIVVISSSGAPLNDVTAKLLKTDSHGPLTVITSHTNDKGESIFKSLLSGRYTLNVSRTPFQDVVFKDFRLKPGTSASVVVTMGAIFLCQ